MHFKTLGLFLLTLTLISIQAYAYTDEPQTDETSFAEEFLELVNDHRHEIKLAPLEISEGMNAIAKRHSQNMAAGSVEFGHLGFPVRCSKARVVLKGGNLCAENVAMGQKNAQRVYLAWMNSPGHRANILHKAYGRVGIGILEGGRHGIMVTQNFRN